MIKTERALAIVIIFALIFISCSKSPTKVVKEYEAAFNSHNIKELTLLFSKDAVIGLPLLNPIKGMNQIRDYAEYDSVLNSHITISDIAENDGKAFFVMALKNDLLKTIGIDEAKYSIIFNISSGKISDISGSTTNETDAKLIKFQKPFMLWAETERPDVLNEIMPNGTIMLNAENAQKYLSLITDWKKTRQTNISAP